MSCVAELVELAKHVAELEEAKLRVVCISTDSVEAARKGRSRFELPFTFVADESHELLKTLDLADRGAGPRSTDAYYATTFVLDENGDIVFRHVATDVRDRKSPRNVIDTARAALEVNRAANRAVPGDRRP